MMRVSVVIGNRELQLPLSSASQTASELSPVPLKPDAPRHEAESTARCRRWCRLNGLPSPSLAQLELRSLPREDSCFLRT